MRFACIYLAIFATCFLALGQPGKTPDGGGLQPGDQIRIRPIEVGHGLAPLFDLELTVTEDGSVSIPAFDLDLDVHTLQPEDAEIIIRSALRKAGDLTRLDLRMFATRDGFPLPGQHCIMMGGRLHQPGPVALTPGMTLAQAIEAAGGATTWGSTKRIRVYREGRVSVLNLDNPTHAGRRVAIHDMIEVPSKTWIGQ